MDIFETIRADHLSIRDILDELLEQTSAAEDTPYEHRKSRKKMKAREHQEDWEELLHDLKLFLVAHNRAEEAILYDALSRIPQRSGLADVRTEEHHFSEELLEDLEEINPQEKSWDTKLALFKNQLESHFAEEEANVFPIIAPTLTPEQHEKMVLEFESLRDDIVEGVKYHPKGKSIINPAGLDLD